MSTPEKATLPPEPAATLPEASPVVIPTPDVDSGRTLSEDLLGEAPVEVGEDEVTKHGLGAWVKNRLGRKKKTVGSAEDEEASVWDRIINSSGQETETPEVSASRTEFTEDTPEAEASEEEAPEVVIPPVIERTEAANKNQSWVYDVIGGDEEPEVQDKSKAPSPDKPEKIKKSFGLLNRAKELGKSITTPVSSENIKDARRMGFAKLVQLKDYTKESFVKHFTKQNEEGKTRLSRTGKIAINAGVLATALLIGYLNRDMSTANELLNAAPGTGGSGSTMTPEAPQPTVSHGASTFEQTAPSAPSTPSPENTVSSVPQSPLNDPQEVPKIDHNTLMENSAPLTASTPPDVLQPGGNVWDFSRTYLKSSGYEGTDAQTAALKNYLMGALGYSEESAHFMTPGMHMPVPDTRHLRELMGIR